jgi:protein tyrosine/serine phosphatase
VTISIAVAYHKLGPYHFRTVTPGVLYRGGNQRKYILHHLVDKYRIKTIVSLRTMDEGGWRPDWFKEETLFCQKKNIRFFNIPMLGKNPPTPEQIDLWLSIVRDSANQPILIHCAEGVVRSGYMVAIYEIVVRNQNNQSVWKSLPRFGHEFDEDNFLTMKNFVLNFTYSSQQKPSPLAPASIISEN